MKGKTDTNSYPFQRINRSLSVRMPKKIRSKRLTNRLNGLHICAKNISICLKYCDICSNVQIICSPVRMVKQTVRMLQGPFVNRSSSVHFVIQTVFCQCPFWFCLSGSQMYKEMCSNQRRELANRSQELKDEYKIASFYNPVQGKKKRQNMVTYQPHSVTLTYSNRPLKIIPTKLVNTHYHTISHIPVQKDTLGQIYVVE